MSLGSLRALECHLAHKSQQRYSMSNYWLKFNKLKSQGLNSKWKVDIWWLRHCQRRHWFGVPLEIQWRTCTGWKDSFLFSKNIVNLWGLVLTRAGVNSIAVLLWSQDRSLAEVKTISRFIGNFLPGAKASDWDSKYASRGQNVGEGGQE